ncbi:MAG: hypothetical protein U0163_13610 [Gemmatimonadaceae bacterium]
MEAEHERLLRQLGCEKGVTWQELNFAISRLMQHHCGAFKSDELLKRGLAELELLEAEQVPRPVAQSTT